jgi:hypothetical protein
MAISKLLSSSSSSSVKYSKSNIPVIGSTDTIKMTPIAWVNLASNQGGIVIDNIPQTYKNLRLVMNLRASVSGALLNSTLTINNDTTAGNYERYAVVASTGSGATFTGGDGALIFNYVVGENMSNSGIFLQQAFDFLGYSDTDRYKSFLSNSSFVDPNATDPNASFATAFLQHTTHKWKSLSGITKLEFSGSFKAGCTAALYGYGSAG